jgi:sortase (surface protein transpeptidase)
MVLLAVVTACPSQDASAHSDHALNTRSDSIAAQTPAGDEDRRAAPPVAILIPAADVNGLIETRGIVDGELVAPSGPWVIAWYEQTARPGEPGNMVMSGHVDYWNVGPAVFASLGHLEAGAEIDVTDAEGSRFVYVVEWVRRYPVADLTTDDLREIVGPTDTPSLTLITCGGAFDLQQGGYLQRLVVRAARVER